MAGHSKWANIMYRKGAQDARRAKRFTKLIREVYVAAREGAPDPDHNPRLRTAVAAAKSQSVPKDNIERAIKKAAGGDGGQERFDTLSSRGLRARRRCRDCRCDHRQPQPDRGHDPLDLQPAWRHARRDRLRELSVSTCWNHSLPRGRGERRRHVRSGARSRCRRMRERGGRPRGHLCARIPERSQRGALRAVRCAGAGRDRLAPADDGAHRREQGGGRLQAIGKRSTTATTCSMCRRTTMSPTMSCASSRPERGRAAWRAFSASIPDSGEPAGA